MGRACRRHRHRHRPRQLGTYASQRSANAAARSMKTEDRSTERGTVSWLVCRYVVSRTDITVKARQQYERAIAHFENGLGAIQLSRLDRQDAADVDRFLEATAEHRWAVALRLGALFGLRRSEVLALRWDDVDIEAESLRAC